MNAFARLAVAASAVCLAACASLPATREDTTPRGSFTLRLIGQQKLDHLLQFGGTTVGGLSGIDYDPEADLFYLISDDRSDFAPTRFYTARLAIDAMRFGDVALQTVVTLKRPDGTAFPRHAADAEAIRYDPQSRSLWWTSEGERHDPSRLIEPFIRHASLGGDYLDEVPLDPMFHITMEARGPRDNQVFEGATLSVDRRSLWISMEDPLIQDGPLPTMREGAWSRISRYDRTASGGFGRLQQQLAYRIDPIPSAGAWTAKYAQNGISEILAIDTTRMLVLERAFALGAGWRIRLFEADWSSASDVKAIDALVDATAFVPLTKRLVLDFGTLHMAIDNLEGLCFGPTLTNGHRTLVFVSDDNFNPGQSTQFLAFEIVPR